MVNVRISGFDSPAQLREHLAEIEEDRNMIEGPQRDGSSANIRREIVALQKDVATLRKQMDTIQQHLHEVAPLRDEHPWLRIALTVAAIALLGNLVQRLRLGTAGAAAVPMIVRQANHRLW